MCNSNAEECLDFFLLPIYNLLQTVLILCITQICPECSILANNYFPDQWDMLSVVIKNHAIKASNVELLTFFLYLIDRNKLAQIYFKSIQ